MEATKSGITSDSKLHFLDYWRIIRLRKEIIAVVFLLVLITVGAVTYWMTPSYVSTVFMRVEKDTPDVTLLGMMGAAGQQYDPYFIATEFRVLRSHMILDKVIDDLKLNRIYGERNKVPEISLEAAYKILSRNIDVKQDRNTSLIEISAYDQDKNLAAQIANRVASFYKEYRLSSRLERDTRGLGTLTNSLAKIQREVDEAQNEVNKYRDQLKVADPVMASSSAQSLSAQTLARLEMERSNLRTQLTGQKAFLSKVEGFANKQELREFLSFAKPTRELTDLLSNLNQAEQQKTTISSEFGPEHPATKRNARMLETVNAQIDRQVQGIMDGLRSQVLVIEETLREVEQSYENKLQEMNTEYASAAPYLRAKEQLENRIRLRNLMEMQLAQEVVNSSISKASSVEVIDEAKPGEKPVKPSKFLNMVLGGIFGLMLGIGLAFFIEYLDTSVKTIDDVELALGAPVLGVIPQNVGSLLSEGNDSPHAEAYRVLRTNILFSRKQNDLRTMTVVSGGAGEGKSTTIFNLAVIFAQQGNRVLIVDSDLRRPSLHRILNVSNQLGLTNYLLKQNTLAEVVQTTPQPDLDFLPSGKLPSSSLGILNSGRMKEFVQEAKARYDFVFFDSPPIMGVSDASVLASEVDMAVLVVQYRKYPLQMTLRAKQMVEKIGGQERLLGVVLNNINISQDSYYYYYSGYYYDYYSRNDESKESGGRKSKGDKSGRGKKPVGPEVNGTEHEVAESSEARK